MKKVVIAGSAKFCEEMLEWKEYFENRGYEVINYPKKIDQTNVKEYQNVYIKFFESLNETDILFVVNEDKNGIKGYIGAETFAELTYTLIQKKVNGQNKKIYLLKMPSEQVACYTEIKNFIELGWIEIFNKGESEA